MQTEKRAREAPFLYQNIKTRGIIIPRVKFIYGSGFVSYSF